jgi:hypothetical protein
VLAGVVGLNRLSGRRLRLVLRKKETRKEKRKKDKREGSGDGKRRKRDEHRDAGSVHNPQPIPADTAGEHAAAGAARAEGAPVGAR